MKRNNNIILCVLVCLCICLLMFSISGCKTKSDDDVSSALDNTSSGVLDFDENESYSSNSAVGNPDAETQTDSNTVNVGSSNKGQTVNDESGENQLEADGDNHNDAQFKEDKPVANQSGEAQSQYDPAEKNESESTNAKDNQTGKDDSVADKTDDNKIADDNPDEGQDVVIDFGEEDEENGDDTPVNSNTGNTSNSEDNNDDSSNVGGNESSETTTSSKANDGWTNDYIIK